MDGGGRFAGSLRESAPARLRQAGAAVSQRRRGEWVESDGFLLLESVGRWRRFARSLDRVANRLAWLPRHTGLIAPILMIASSAGYAAVSSGQAGKIIDLFNDVPDPAPNPARLTIPALPPTRQR